jgi:hypothetical protein
VEEGSSQDDNISRPLFLEHVITLPRKASREGTRPTRHMADDVCTSHARISHFGCLDPDSYDKSGIDVRLKLDSVSLFGHTLTLGEWITNIKCDRIKLQSLFLFIRRTIGYLSA